MLKAGKGGNGAIAYFSDKKIRYGAPDGGDGGEGGNIEVQAHRPLHDLSSLRHRSIKGVDGQSGGMGALMQVTMARRARTEARPYCVCLQVL